MGRLKELQIFQRLRPLFGMLLCRLLMLSKRFGVTSFGSMKLVRARYVGEIFKGNFLLFPSEPETRVPNYSSQGQPESHLFPELVVRVIPASLVRADQRVSSVLWDQTLLIPQGAPPGPWDIRVGEPTVGGVLWQENWDLLLHTRCNDNPLPAGIFVGTWSPHNWYHWIIDILPNVAMCSLLPKEFDLFPILIPAQIQDRPNWLEPLDIVRQGREIRFLQPGSYTFIEKLAWIDGATVPGPMQSHRVRRPLYALHKSALNFYRSMVLEELNLHKHNPRPWRKIFLARAQGSHRPYNQEQLLKISADFGYETVYLENLGFEESVRVMLESSSVVGPHGAGLANLIFARPETQVLFWTWPEFQDHNWFTNVAALAGSDFTVLEGEMSDDRTYKLDPKLLIKHLEIIESKFASPD